MTDPFWIPEESNVTPGGVILPGSHPLPGPESLTVPGRGRDVAICGKPIEITHAETFTVTLKPPPCRCCWCTGEVPWSDNFMGVCVLEFHDEDRAQGPGDPQHSYSFWLPCSARAWDVRFKPPYAFMRPVKERTR